MPTAKRCESSGRDILAEAFREPKGQIASEPGFLGRLHSETLAVEAGSWQEILLRYAVGSAGLAKATHP